MAEIKGIDLIKKERRDQLTKAGQTIQEDVFFNKDRELSKAARKLLKFDPSGPPPGDWDTTRWIKMKAKPYKERLIIAGALIAAELDRLIEIEKTEKS